MSADIRKKINNIVKELEKSGEKITRDDILDKFADLDLTEECLLFYFVYFFHIY